MYYRRMKQSGVIGIVFILGCATGGGSDVEMYMFCAKRALP
jgi:hypothetical protein